MCSAQSTLSCPISTCSNNVSILTRNQPYHFFHLFLILLLLNGDALVFLTVYSAQMITLTRE
jgi:hypothetical protein